MKKKNSYIRNEGFTDDRIRKKNAKKKKMRKEYSSWTFNYDRRWKKKKKKTKKGKKRRKIEQIFLSWKYFSAIEEKEWNGEENFSENDRLEKFIDNRKRTKKEINLNKKGSRR